MTKDGRVSRDACRCQGRAAAKPPGRRAANESPPDLRITCSVTKGAFLLRRSSLNEFKISPFNK